MQITSLATTSCDVNKLSVSQDGRFQITRRLLHRYKVFQQVQEFDGRKAQRTKSRTVFEFSFHLDKQYTKIQISQLRILGFCSKQETSETLNANQTYPEF